MKTLTLCIVHQGMCFICINASTVITKSKNAHLIVKISFSVKTKLSSCNWKIVYVKALSNLTILVASTSPK